MKDTSENGMVGDLITSATSTLLAVQTERTPWIRRVIEHLATQGGRAYFHWHPETGLTRNTGQRRSTNAVMSLPHFLLHTEDIILDAVYVVEDASLEDDSVEPLLRSLVERLTGTPSTLVLLSKEATSLPESLSNLAVVINPDKQRAHIEANAAPLNQRLVGQRVMTVALAKEDRARLQQCLQSQSDPDTNAKQVYHSKVSGAATWKAVSGALAPRAQAVHETSFLQYYSPEKCQLGLPGFHRLRQEVGLNESWLIDGAAGCGRSLVPFVAAEALQCGVIRFDGAGLAAQGNAAQTEATRKALVQLTESMAPVVVWFDQIQKSDWERLQPSDWLGFAKSTPCLAIGTSGHGAAEHGTTWSRAFEQRWWIGLPEPDQRHDVIAFQLKARGLECPPAILERLAHRSAGLSAAQIEADLLEVIQASLDQERAFQPESLCRFWERHRGTPTGPSPVPPGWRNVHAETREVPLLPFTVLT